MHQFLYVYHKDDYDWVIKADTDAWFSTPNFKGYAQYFDPSRDWYFGSVYTQYLSSKNIVYNGGGCNALSRGTINKLNRVYLTKEFLDPAPRGPIGQICQNVRCYHEDIPVAACLKSVGIFPANLLDVHYKTRWSWFKKESTQAMTKGTPLYYFQDRFEGQAVGEECCSEHMISFHRYKNLQTLFDDYSKLDAMYSEKSKNNWMDHSLPPKPVTFLMKTSINEEIDEYFNIKNPPKGQKLWKGVDNLWNYLDSEQSNVIEHEIEHFYNNLDAILNLTKDKEL